MPTSLAEQCGISVYELRQQFVAQLPTVAALIYTSRGGNKITVDEAAGEAVDLVDALLEEMMSEVEE